MCAKQTDSCDESVRRDRLDVWSVTRATPQVRLADKSFLALPLDRFANLKALAKVARAADTSDNIRGRPFREEIGFLECEYPAAMETVTKRLLHFPLNRRPMVEPDFTEHEEDFP